ncbi:hypothetical protein CPB97_007382 [Podila verticillata]|nr:hypothetical protein CPB97_007382 [Podila verticillata]
MTPGKIMSLHNAIKVFNDKDLSDHSDGDGDDDDDDYNNDDDDDDDDNGEDYYDDDEPSGEVGFENEPVANWDYDDEDDE